MRISFFFSSFALLQTTYTSRGHVQTYHVWWCQSLSEQRSLGSYWDVPSKFIGREERKIKHRKCIVIRRWRRRHKTLAIHDKMMLHLIWHHQNCHRQILSLRLMLMSNGGIDNHALPRHATHIHTLEHRRRWHRFPCETIFNNRGMFIFKDNYFNYALCSMCSIINVDHVSVNLIF